MIAPVKSFATSWPSLPDFRIFSRTRAKLAGLGVKSAGMTFPPE